jgi:hypothetical protein
MRSLVVAGILLTSSSALAMQKELTFSLLDIDVEQRGGTPLLVDVALTSGGHLTMSRQSVIPVDAGGYNAVVHRVFDEGSITAVLHIERDPQGFVGEYSIVSGSGAYAGASGHGSLRKLSGREAAASSEGVYRVRFRVNVPDVAMNSGP